MAFLSNLSHLLGRNNKNKTNEPLFQIALHSSSLAATRSWQQFLKESRSHGWPSFRDDEVNWEHVRCLKNGECVSVDGTHLGHNLPDRNGNRYCINLVSIAGKPTASSSKQYASDLIVE
mmetsp:Transcript_23480/g.65321  ORF Transcript_23480/g.65321 Transcript_23480/m.65321 type:complete len:119 (+) Transcript_23480:129-485(+)|eukprot:CAMPEP_0168751042 /NCGR_PEP_ID=MMETSP0724-20121128/17608_1 /TAXON_ID=265536 /ORGANISM="Amphiprora sp., Strain CCMP467" /LENGTH=118 /DNA_ID=CAMNT_0008799131 /DNA_START=55 /DNA_END=411 /DNA_ORIENTATION=-